MKKIWWTIPGLLIVLVAGPASGQDKQAFTFLGAKGCMKCHLTKKSGAAYKIWKAGPHAKAFETLASEKAKAIAAKKGIEDPQKADACLKCHVTAHGVEASQLGPKFNVAEGVSCESCHGPGSGYDTKETKEQILAGKLDPLSVGLLKPDEKTCIQCHNEESPTYKPFDFKKRAAEIAHAKPK